MRTELCQICWLWHPVDRDCESSTAAGEAWLVKPPIDDPVIVTQESDNPVPITGTIRLKRPYKRKGQ